MNKNQADAIGISPILECLGYILRSIVTPDPYIGTITNGSYVSSAQATAVDGCLGGSAVARPLTMAATNQLYIGRLYPNPTTGIISIDINIPVQTSLNVSVVDMFGRYLSREKKTAIAGNNKITMNLATVPPGNYFIELSDGHAISEKYKVMKL